MQGDYAGATDVLKSGIASVQESLATAPADTSSLRVRAGLQASLAQIYEMQGDSDAFLVASQSAVEQLEALFAPDRDDVAVGGNLASAYGMRGEHLLNLGRTRDSAARAEQDIRKCIAVIDHLMVKNPQHTLLAANLAVAHNHLGVALQYQGQVEAALASHRRAVGILAPMVDKDPDNTMLRHDHATFTSGLSESLRMAGQFEPSVATARAAMTEFERVPQASRDELVAGLDFAQAHYNLGKALFAFAEQPGRPPEAARSERRDACSNYRRGLALLDQHEQRFGSKTLYGGGPAEIKKEMAQAILGCS
jgi:tetratricopeptide (TPR) repeat protein